MTLSVALSAQPAETPTPARSVNTQAPRPQPSEDTVAISESAQVSELNTQGLSPSEIADTLGIPVANVNSDLGFVANGVTSNSTAPPVATAPATTLYEGQLSNLTSLCRGRWRAPSLPFTTQ